ncbi:hypothetical protein KVP02_13225, partial [Halobacterium salinarum]|uniref:hypothetical protein n=1 Tax=Halobacterium salinarum TaxID=2242 RepID=UPI001F2DD61F
VGNSSTSSNEPPTGSPEPPRVDVAIQEVAARLDKGTGIQDAVRQELENVSSDIEAKVLKQIRRDIPDRL